MADGKKEGRATLDLIIAEYLAELGFEGDELKERKQLWLERQKVIVGLRCPLCGREGHHQRSGDVYWCLGGEDPSKPCTHHWNARTPSVFYH